MRTRNTYTGERERERVHECERADIVQPVYLQHGGRTVPTGHVVNVRTKGIPVHVCIVHWKKDGLRAAKELGL